MSVAGFLTDQASAGRNLSVGPATGLGNVFGAALTNAWVNGLGGRYQYYDRPLTQREDEVRRKFGKDPWELTGNKAMRDTLATDPVHNQEALRALETKNRDDLDTWIMKGRTEAPAKYDGLRTTGEIRDEARRVSGMNERHFQEMMIRNPSSLSRTIGGFTGSIVGAMIDPPNLVTLPLGAGEVKAGLKGFRAARAVLKAAAADGTINAGIELAEQPAMAAWQKELGHRYGFGEAAGNVALAFTGGTALSGLIRGGVRGLKGASDYMGSVSADMLDRISSNEKLPSAVRDAAAFMSRQAHIDESAPPGTIKTGADLRIHRETAQKVADDFEAYQTQTAAKENLAPKNDNAAQGQAVDTKAQNGGIEPETAQKAIKSLPRSEYLVEPDVPTAEILKKNGRSEDVPLDAVRSHQSKMRWAENSKGKFSEPLIEGYGDKPVVGRLENGEYIVFDGNHRVVKAINEGQKSMPMHVVDVKKYDPERAGRKPKKAKPGEDEDLLAALKADPMDDMKPPERMSELDLPEGLSPEISADRVAIAESDMKALVEEIGDENFALEDGREISVKDFADEIQGKKALIEAMKTCRIA